MGIACLFVSGLGFTGDNSMLTTDAVITCPLPNAFVPHRSFTLDARQSFAIIDSQFLAKISWLTVAAGKIPERCAALPDSLFQHIANTAGKPLVAQFANSASRSQWVDASSE